MRVTFSKFFKYSAWTVLGLALLGGFIHPLGAADNNIGDLWGTTHKRGNVHALAVELFDSTGNPIVDGISINSLAGSGLFVDEDDTIMMYSYSTNQVNITALTTSGSPVIRLPIGGIGELSAGMTVTGSALTGDTGTIVGVSQQPAQTPLDGSTSADIHSNTTIDGIAAIDCARIKQYMLISALNQASTEAFGIPINTYSVTDCESGSVTMSAAATATTSLTNVNFTPAIVMNANLDETHSSITTDNATFIAKSQTSLRTSYRIRTNNAIVSDSFTETNMATDRVTQNSQESDPLEDGILQSGMVLATEGDPVPGATYIVVQLMKGGIPYITLACGTATEVEPLQFPGECKRPEEIGRHRTFSQAGPVTGANAYIQVPSNVSWELIAAQILLQTSSTPGYRIPLVKMTSREGVTDYNAPISGTGVVGPSALRLVSVGQDVNNSQNDTNLLTIGVTYSDDDSGAANEAVLLEMPAPGTLYRNVIECITGSVSNATGATTGGGIFQLVDDSGGAGANVIYSFTLSSPVGSVDNPVVGNGATHTICPANPWIMTINTVTALRTSAASPDTIHRISMKGHVELVGTVLYSKITPNRLIGGGKAQIVFTSSSDTFTNDIWSEPQFHVIERWSL